MSMEQSAPAPTILKIRTFADDVKRAGGSVVVPQAETKAPQSARTETPLQAAVAREFARPASQTPAQKSPLDIAADNALAKHAAIDDESTFDIRSAAREAVADATIIRDNRGSKSWSFMDNLVHETARIIEELKRVLQPPKAPATIIADIAPAATRGETPVAESGADAQAPAVEVTPPLVTASLHAQQGLAVAPSWRRVSEPREGAASEAETRAFLEQLRTAAPVTQEPKPETPVLKQARPVRSSDAEVRLRALAASLPTEAAPTEQKAPLREIPFIPPTYEHPEAATPLRTYRDDALMDVQTAELGATRIAAAEASRRALERAPIVIAQPPSRVAPILATIGIVLALGALGVGGYALLSRTTIEFPVTRPDTYFAADRTEDLPLPADRSALLADLDQAREAATIDAQQSLVWRFTKDGATADTASVLAVLDPRAPGSFLRSLDPRITIGAYGSTKTPFIVIKTSAFEIGFAGMLAWEDSMSADLAPFFGEPVQRSYEPGALTVDQTRAAHFRDHLMRNMDVRLLVDETGADRIIYTFVDETTIVIAKDAPTLSAVVEMLR